MGWRVLHIDLDNMKMFSACSLDYTRNYNNISFPKYFLSDNEFRRVVYEMEFN